jgi:diguanylate cyclase (GGDEF)-like protein
MIRIGWLSAQRQEAERALVRQATIDSLTGLPNRLEFLARLEDALAAPRGGPDGDAVAVLFCDLDGFKDINDRYGHQAGDELLMIVAQRLSASMRVGDTVARYGGDEFLALCTGTSRHEVLRVICPRLREAIAAPVAVTGGTVTVGASVGVVFAEGVTDPATLISRADAAMYAAKQRRDREPAMAVTVA